MKNSIKSTLSLLSFLIIFQISANSQIELCAIPIEDNGLIELQVKTSNFDEIISYQFGVAWSINKFSLVSIENFNPDLSGYDEDKFSPIFDNVPEQISLIRTLWFSSGVSGVTLEDGALLFSLILEPIGNEPSESYGIVADNQFAIEIVNDDFIELDVVLDNCEGIGAFNINTSTVNQNPLSFELNPNPVSDLLYATFEKETSGTISIYNLIGELMHTQQVKNEDAVTLDLSLLSSNAYIFKLEDNERKTIETRFIVKK